ncbi:MAG: DegT/DnrJ/EryC1/StrS family aminotransferase [Wenzhouxiangella sp.]
MITLNDLKRELEPIRPELNAAVTRVLDSGWFALGREVEAFEQEFSEFLGGGFLAGVGNGTDALELALRALELGAGDTVITAANAGGYATTAILACGASPVYADVDPDDGLLDPAQLLALARQSGARALIITHLYGRMASMRALMEQARQADLLVIEDCAQAHGASMDGNPAGSWGDVGCFSFYPTKNLGALGDGGAVYARNRVLVERIHALRQYGWTDKYASSIPGGRNSRLDEIQAACLRARLPTLAMANLRRRAIGRRYLEQIDNQWITLPHRPDSPADVFHLFPITCVERNALADHLAASDIQSAVHYPRPDYAQPAWRGRVPERKLPITDRRAGEILSLPCHPALSEQEIDHVIDTCNRFQP